MCKCLLLLKLDDTSWLQHRDLGYDVIIVKGNPALALSPEP
jgi:hypothetical protein